jgi:hypothetical protein
MSCCGPVPHRSPYCGQSCGVSSASVRPGLTDLSSSGGTVTGIIVFFDHKRHRRVVPAPQVGGSFPLRIIPSVRAATGAAFEACCSHIGRAMTLRRPVLRVFHVKLTTHGPANSFLLLKSANPRHNASRPMCGMRVEPSSRLVAAILADPRLC